MSFLKKLFGKKEPAAEPWSPPKESPIPEGAPAMMKVWDDYGRIGEIPRERWRTQVLPINFRNAWNKPEELANLIHVTLNDGFITDCLEPARQLHRIDSEPKRGATFLAVVLLQLKKFDEAEKVTSEALQKHGPDGTLLTNLAKAYSGKGDEKRAEQTLWQALEVDPNLDNGLLWYEAIHRDRGGENSGLEALRRVAVLPGSWRAQIWLARAALKAHNLDAAMGLYREAFSHVAKPIPADLLWQMSGDLGQAGHLPEILQLVGPHFDVSTHGIMVGNNLIKAHFDLGQIDAAQRILNQLYALNRTDWKESLSFWDTEIAKFKVEISPRVPDEQLKVAMLTIDGPVWLKPSSPAAELFPVSTDRRINVGFLGSSAEIATNSKRIQHQLSDAPGRLSRALPLFLAEEAHFSSNAHVQTLVPWIANETGGFVLMGDRCSDEDAAAYARQGEVKNDYVVVTHIKTTADPWAVDLRLIRTIDGKCLGDLTVSFPYAQPEEGLLLLNRQLLTLLERHAEVEMASPANHYQIPGTPHFGNYLLRLEQLLAVRCAGMDGVKNNLNGEREIIDGNLQMCLDHPDNVTTRILLAQTLLGLKKVRPDILPEYKTKIALLQNEKTLREPTQGVVQRLFNEVFAA